MSCLLYWVHGRLQIQFTCFLLVQKVRKTMFIYLLLSCVICRVQYKNCNNIPYITIILLFLACIICCVQFINCNIRLYITIILFQKLNLVLYLSWSNIMGIRSLPKRGGDLSKRVSHPQAITIYRKGSLGNVLRKFWKFALIW